jgi:hypothetical protein
VRRAGVRQYCRLTAVESGAGGLDQPIVTTLESEAILYPG